MYDKDTSEDYLGGADLLFRLSFLTFNLIPTEINTYKLLRIAMNIDRLATLLLHFFKFVLSFFIFDVENRDLLEMTGY